MGLDHAIGQDLRGEEMHRITDCRASTDYRLWLRFDDGLEGSVYLGSLLEIGAFEGWRNIEEFCRVSVDPVAATVVWETGVELDPDTLYRDLVGNGSRKEFGRTGLAPAVG